MFLDEDFSAVLAQTVVDDGKCTDKGFTCPKDGEPSYKKYCCVETNGGRSLYSCCNPYFGLVPWLYNI